MSITTYSELQTAIIAWSHRSGLDVFVPDFIALAEAKFNRLLRTRDMETTASITPASGVGALPTGYLEFRRVYINSTPVVELEYLSPENFYLKFPKTAVEISDTSRYFTIEGSNIILSNLTTDTDLSVLYYQSIPNLATNTTNWLLTKHPDLYLYASMIELCDYIQDTNDAAKWTQKAIALIADITQSDYSGKHSGSAMRVIAA